MNSVIKPAIEGSVQSSDYSETPLWLDDIAAAPRLPNTLLKEVDVAIVGSGYTGLNAALETSRGGLSTLVMDAENIGFGCSTRNGGQISTSVKPSFKTLSERYNPQTAKAIRAEGETALEWIEDLINQENIECDFSRSGRFHAAHSPKHFNRLIRETDQLRKDEGIDSYPVLQRDQHKELGSDSYFGGVVFTRHASLQPAKYHRGLLQSAVEAGVHITENCAVQNIEKRKKDEGYLLTTAKGPVKAKQVIIATNGYTSNLTPWLQRRVIPIGSYIIATEPLPKALMDKLFPSSRIASDTCKVVYYYRASPDRKRIVFGGRVSAKETDPKVSGPNLYKEMCRIFPELNNYKISHSWAGKVAYTFDETAHTGSHKGIHYALGYCGSGVSMSSYLGMRLGQKVLGKVEGKTAFDDLPFPTRPFYTGNPWFLPATVKMYQWRDKLQRHYAKTMTTNLRSTE